VTKVKLTYLRIFYLKTITDLCEKSPVRLARAKDIIRFTEGTEPCERVRGNAMLMRLIEAELLERPARGCYRLSEKGKKAIERYEIGFETI